MSWFINNNNKSKTSDFFKGINIFDKLKNSIYGQIKTSINNIFEYDFTKDYILPKIIVMGNESSGKSCLLENIIKCQIFPRGTGICTKCPIHLKLLSSETNKYSITIKNKEKILKKKEDIYNIIKDEMKNMEITDDEIIINISEKNLPTFDFYDLPGIVSYPPEDAEKTRNITKKYLMENNLIILCVVPATTTRLTSCNSIALIQELNLEEKTILALTMADRIQFNNIPELLINRILKESDEIKNMKFDSCVAIVNRTHNDVYSLEENDENEIKWFKSNIINNIPKDRIKEGKIISENITINNLIKKIDLLYSKYIEKEWKPNIIQKILDRKNALLVEKDNIGFTNVTNDIIHKIYSKIFDKCNIENIFFIDNYIKINNNYTATTSAYAKIINGNVFTWGNKDNGGDSSAVQHLLKDVEKIYSTHGSFTALLKNGNVVTWGGQDIMDKNIYTKLQKYNIIDNVINNLDFNIFEYKIDNIIDEIFDDQCDLKLNRFSLLKNEILKIIKTKIQKIFNEKIKEIKRILSNKLGSYIIENNDLQITYFQKYINNLFNNLIISNFILNFDIKIDKKLIIEDENFILLRSKLNKEINKIDQHYSKIKKMKVN